MQDRQDDDYSRFNDEVDGVRKALEQCAPDFIIDFGEHHSVVTDASQSSSNFNFETGAETAFPAFIPRYCFFDVLLSFQSNREATFH